MNVFYEEFEDTEGVIRKCKSKCQKKMTIGETMIYKTIEN